MSINDQQNEGSGVLKELREALPVRLQAWLNDMATWAKEEIDQDPKNPGKNYLYFLHEQTKVFAYQSGLQQENIKLLVYQGFLQKYGQTIEVYALEKYKEHLFLSVPNDKKSSNRIKNHERRLSHG